MYLLDKISDRAKATYDLETKPVDYHKWVEHWFSTAEEIKAEMQKEGLVETVAHIDELVAEQRRFVQPRQSEG